MSERAGIPATLVDERSLEDKIEFQLNQVLADPEITNPYTDRQDKQNVLRRELILAAIATIIQHQNEKMVDDSKGATVSLDGEVSPFSELMAAWRGLQHATKRLNDGLKGELVAAPLSRESIERQGVVSADLQHQYGRLFIRKSLRTKDPKQPNWLASSLIDGLEREWLDLRFGISEKTPASDLLLLQREFAMRQWRSPMSASTGTHSQSKTSTLD